MDPLCWIVEISKEDGSPVQYMHARTGDSWNWQGYKPASYPFSKACGVIRSYNRKFWHFRLHNCVVLFEDGLQIPTELIN